MKKLFIGNFDFEHQLASTERWNAPAALRRLNAELASVWLAVADAGDYVWTPSPIASAFFEKAADRGLPLLQPVSREIDVTEQVEVVPWGWTETIRNWTNQHGWCMNASPQKIVRKANSRRFSFALEHEHNCGLEGSAVVDSMESLSTALDQLPAGYDRWVIKAEFSMSARERILGEGRELSEQAVNWARKRLERDGVLFFEPWVERMDEAGIQFTIPQSGPVVLEGIAPLLTDERGAYRGSRFGADQNRKDLWASAVETGRAVAEKLQAEGYFGPLGIDAVRYRDHQGEIRIRPLQDINARYTMGRLALGFRRLLEPGETGSWLHLRHPQCSAEELADWYDARKEQLPQGTKMIQTSPIVIGDSPVRHGTVVLISSSQEEAEKIIL